MRLLLDTHALLWALADPDRLNDTARDALRDGRNVVLVSAVSAWELAIKQAAGKLRAPDDLLEVVDATGFDWLPISAQHALLAGALPPLHRDPFDRMLVAQARQESLIIVTRDRGLRLVRRGRSVGRSRCALPGPASTARTTASARTRKAPRGQLTCQLAPNAGGASSVWSTTQ